MWFVTFIDIVIKALWIMFGVSVTASLLNNYSLKNRLKRVGYVVNGSKLSLIERITYFIQDYAYLIVPWYNIKKSLFKNLFKKGILEYENERKNKFKERRMLYQINDDNTLSLVTAAGDDKERDTKKFIKIKEDNQPKVKEEVKQRAPELRNTKTVEPKKEHKVLPKQIEEKSDSYSSEFSSIEEEFEYYRDLFRKQKAEYNIAQNDPSCTYEERTILYNDLIETQKHYRALKSIVEKRNEIDALKRAKDSIQNQLNEVSTNKKTLH